MRPTALTLALAVSAAAFTTAVRADDEADALRKKAVDWLTANSRFEKKSMGKITGMVDEFVKDGHNFTILLGADITKKKKPAMLCGWSGDFFPFDLSEGQAKSLNLKPTGVEGNANRRYGKPAAKLAATLSNLKVPSAGSLDGGKPITGTFRVKVLRPPANLEAVRMRMILKFPEYVDDRFLKVRQYPTEDITVGFSFKPINPADGKTKPVHGPVAAFFDIVELPDGDKTKAIQLSNTLGILLDVE